MLIFAAPGRLNQVNSKVLIKNTPTIPPGAFTLLIIIKGAHFCKVDNKRRIRKDLPFKIEINHPWKGAAPSFSIKPIHIIRGE